MLTAQPGRDGEFPGRVGVAHLVEEGAALGGEQQGEGLGDGPGGVRSFTGSLWASRGSGVGQSVDGAPPAEVSRRARHG